MVSCYGNSFVDIYKPGQRPNTIPKQSGLWIVNVSIPDYLTASTSVYSILSVDIDPRLNPCRRQELGHRVF